MENPTGILASALGQMIKYFSSMSTFRESVSHNSCCGGRADLIEYDLFKKSDRNAFGSLEMKYIA